jgi:hypothetical protein
VILEPGKDSSDLTMDMVDRLKERLRKMGEDIDQVKAAADRLNNGDVSSSSSNNNCDASSNSSNTGSASTATGEDAMDITEADCPEPREYRARVRTTHLYKPQHSIVEDDAGQKRWEMSPIKRYGKALTSDMNRVTYYCNDINDLVPTCLITLNSYCALESPSTNRVIYVRGSTTSLLSNPFLILTRADVLE